MFVFTREPAVPSGFSFQNKKTEMKMKQEANTEGSWVLQFYPQYTFVPGTKKCGIIFRNVTQKKKKKNQNFETFKL